jgi:plasmid stabilization system protein ParE
MYSLALTRRAIFDIEEIEKYSKKHWGTTVAKEYLKSIEDALTLLQNQPDILHNKPDISEHFKIYKVRKHIIFCTVIQTNIFVLTIKHAAMDLPERLLELEPQLLQEAAYLNKKLATKKGS